MAKCFYCGDKISGYPFVCRLCDEAHCGKHRLPETHECINIGVYKSSSYRNTQLSKNREMKQIKNSGTYRPQGDIHSSSSTSTSTSKLTFNTSIFGEQTVYFLDNLYLSAFVGGMIFGLAQIVSLLGRFGFGINFTFLSWVILGAGLGFVFLYSIRRLVGNRYGISSPFGLWPLGIVITLLTTLFGLIFYLFGFFYDEGGNSRSRAILGITGTLTSFGLWFIGEMVLPMIIDSGIATSFGIIIASIAFAFRSFLWWGIINLIPFGFLDGKKVYDYNTGYYIVLVILAFVCFFLS